MSTTTFISNVDLFPMVDPLPTVSYVHTHGGPHTHGRPHAHGGPHTHGGPHAIPMVDPIPIFHPHHVLSHCLRHRSIELFPLVLLSKRPKIELPKGKLGLFSFWPPYTPLPGQTARAGTMLLRPQPFYSTGMFVSKARMLFGKERLRRADFCGLYLTRVKAMYIMYIFLYYSGPFFQSTTGHIT